MQKTRQREGFYKAALSLDSLTVNRGCGFVYSPAETVTA